MMTLNLCNCNPVLSQRIGIHVPCVLPSGFKMGRRTGVYCTGMLTSEERKFSCLYVLYLVCVVRYLATVTAVVTVASRISWKL